ncbi:hypothetical protein BRAO375_2560036 [Bradyrhizobium sp. ORS 375]|nr:hypothetical protein BRAO375_2560036 [Bradyrhizobium sp. ORS 375]
MQIAPAREGRHDPLIPVQRLKGKPLRLGSSEVYVLNLWPMAREPERGRLVVRSAESWAAQHDAVHPAVNQLGDQVAREHLNVLRLLDTVGGSQREHSMETQSLLAPSAVSSMLEMKHETAHARTGHKPRRERALQQSASE